MRVDSAFIERLQGFWQAVTSCFLAAHGEAIGRRSSHDPDGEVVAMTEVEASPSRRERKRQGA